MIRLKKRPPCPAWLSSEGVRRHKEELEKRVAAGERIKSKDFSPEYWRRAEVRDALVEMHNSKCCYCERKRDATREPDVEHFRPKAAVTEAPDHPGYWWLAYEWSNYLFSCKHCNQEHKKNQFPLRPGGTRARSEADDLQAERPVLLNPREEDPEELFGYVWDERWGVLARPVGKDRDGRGSRIIEILGLDRPELNDERGNLTDLFQAIAVGMLTAERLNRREEVDQFATKIKLHTSADRAFAGFARCFFRTFGLAEYVSDD